MNKYLKIFLSFIFLLCFGLPAYAQDKQYTIGIDDILEISVLQPETIIKLSVVAPDGSVSFPYIGSIYAKGLTLLELQSKIENKLSDGFLLYPVVTVILAESRSRKFFVYGEVIRPGTFPLIENSTVLQAISLAGGFTKYGSSSKVKLLRPRKDKPGYNTIKINIKAVMEGDAEEDILLGNGDILVVSEGVF